MAPDDFLPRFTFFFDVSLSFFEEIAASARTPHLARLTRERYGAKDRAAGASSSTRRPPASTSPGAALQQHRPRHRAGDGRILAGCSRCTRRLRRGAVLPTEFGARIAVATQNILREEAHLTDVIDPLGGSYYVRR